MSDYAQLVDKAADALVSAWYCEDAGDGGEVSRKWSRHFAAQAAHLIGKDEGEVLREVRKLAGERYDG